MIENPEEVLKRELKEILSRHEKEMSELKSVHAEELKKCVDKCWHRWKENGYDSHKYGGIQYYRCEICNTSKSESY